MYSQELCKTIDIFSNPTLCFTDGSKNDVGTGAAFCTYNNNVQYMFTLPPICSSYAAELIAIAKCLTILAPSMETIVICTDSLSELLALKNNFSVHPLIQDILFAIESPFGLNSFNLMMSVYYFGIRMMENNKLCGSTTELRWHFRSKHVFHQQAKSVILGGSLNCRCR
ncbi:uncharacterized protein LOC106663155 [Cimex lectularius]|uniref:RNase H type-1 domain-containing protein n=1 Tax=Cimex lectularius TaxID=79782 RepID=A0A8I6RDM7_CIMLE|nr:uncharacterized protein LOC106663155 [Cimex lectularius]